MRSPVFGITRERVPIFRVQKRARFSDPKKDPRVQALSKTNVSELLWPDQKPKTAPIFRTPFFLPSGRGRSIFVVIWDPSPAQAVTRGL